MNTKTKGILLVLAASVIWAIESVFVRYANQNSMPIKTAAFALFFGSITALSYSLIKKCSFKLNKTEWKSIFIIVLGGTVLAQPLYYIGISKTALVNALLISHLQPIFVIIFGYFIMKERLTKYDFLGGFLLFAGAVFATSKSIDNLVALNFGNFGDLIILASTLMWAATIFPAKMNLGGVPASVAGGLRFGIASLFLLAYLLFFYNIKIDNAYQIIIGMLIGIGIIFYYEGLKRIKAAQVAFIELASPFFAALLGLYFFNETITTLQIIAFPVLGLGLYFIARRE